MVPLYNTGPGESHLAVEKGGLTDGLIWIKHKHTALKYLLEKKRTNFYATFEATKNVLTSHSQPQEEQN